MKARMSSLPVLQFCGQAQITSAKGAGNANTDIGTAFHAKCSGAPNAADLIARLTDEARSELESLIPPQPMRIEGGPLLEYADAIKEAPVGLTADGNFAAKDADHAILDGTCDLYWVVDNRAEGGKRVAYVADIKKSAYAAPDGAYTLQAVGYAIAIASLEDCDGYVTGIWDATEGAWEWSDYVDAWSEQAERNLDRVVAAARNYGGEYNVGSHCASCYGRPHCPQYLLPPEVAETSLAIFTAPGGLTHANALQALVIAKRALDTAKRVEDLVKAYAREQGGLVDPERGKVWKPIRTRGRSTLDRKALERDQPETVQRYTIFGADYEQFKWVNHKPVIDTTATEVEP